MAFFRVCRGSVSVVLSILMLPMLTFASLMVDASSVEAADVVLVGAAELAMNAALSNYDTVLAQRYGIYAMSQLGDDYGQELTDLVSRHINTTLQTSKPLNVKGHVISAFPMENSNLTNPDVLRRSIVDFMKYRGVVDAGTSLYNSLDEVMKLGSKAKLVEKQVAASKELDGISKICAELYSTLRVYDEAVEEYRNDSTADFPYLLLDNAIYLAEQIKAEIPAIARANGNLKDAIDNYLIESGGAEDSLSIAMTGEYETNTVLFGEDDPDGIIRQLRAGKEYIDAMLAETPREDSGAYLKQISETVNIDNNFIGVPPFYIYLMTSYGGANLPEEGNAASVGLLLKNIKRINESAKSTSSVDESISYSMDVFEGSPSGEGSEEVGEFADVSLTEIMGITNQLKVMTGAFADLTALVNSDASDFRDSLLITEYIMENFSCLTSSSDKATYTGIPIDPENNRIYGCEAEYILFGNRGSEERKLWFFTLRKEAGPESNIAAAKRAVFAVRFSVNSIFALSDSSIDALTLAPAMSIQAVSGGTVPFQSAQLVLKLALALGESAIDLSEIVQNKEVPLLKTASTWRCSVNGFVDMISNKIIDQVETLARDGVQDYVGMIQSCIDGVVDDTNQEIEAVMSGILSDVGVLVESRFISVFDSVYSILKTRAELALVDIYQGGNFNPSAFADSVIGEIEEFVSEKGMEEYLGAVIEQAKDVLKNEIIPIASNVAIQVSGTGASLHGGLYNLSLLKISEAVDGLVQMSLGEITARTGEVTNSVGEKIKEIVQTQGDELADTLAKSMAEQAKYSLDYLFYSFLPQESTPSFESVSTDAGILTLDYEDYLRLFTFLTLSGAQRDVVLLRIADVIQLNCSLHHPKGLEFRLEDSYTQLEIYMDAEVPALLIPYSYRLYGGDKKYYAAMGY